MNQTIKTLNAIDKCPHCSVSNPVMIQAWSGLTHGSNSNSNRLWGAFVCNNCGGMVVAYSHSEYENYLFNHPNGIYPSGRTANSDIPDVARTFLQQAMDTLHAPDAAAVMAGSAVDAMLKEKGLSKGSLYARIDEALAQHILTQGMADWAHSVRLGSNRPRHADEDNPHVSPEEAKQSVEFAEALGNFLFVLTAKIKRGIEAAQNIE